MTGAYVFLGPTLAEPAARAEFEAVYLPPAGAGDVYRLWHLRPRAIGIVDGCFDRAPAVWHKEILWAMEQGVHVFGAGGLGALRAVELAMFGMRGVGWVYEAFRDGVLDADDEVAVTCGPGERGYPAQSEAMVNMRRTLESARDGQVISAATRDLLTAAGQALHYRDRSWPALLAAGAAAGAGPAELSALRGWLPAGRIDQLAADAVAMLREMRAFLTADPAPQQVSWRTASTALWVEAQRHWSAAADNAADNAAG